MCFELPAKVSQEKLPHSRFILSAIGRVIIGGDHPRKEILHTLHETSTQLFDIGFRQRVNTDQVTATCKGIYAHHHQIPYALNTRGHQESYAIFAQEGALAVLERSITQQAALYILDSEPYKLQME